MSSLYWDTSAPYLVPSIVSMTKRDPSELIHIVFGFCDGIEFRLTMTDKEIESLMGHTFEPVLGPRIVFNDHDGNFIVPF